MAPTDRARAPRRGGGADRAVAGRGTRPAPHPLTTLQRHAGNRAVADALSIQREGEQRAPHTFGFSTEEQDWIDEIWARPGIRMMFQAYPGVPDPVLARVHRILEDDGSESTTTEGVHDPSAGDGDVNIEIADTAYDIPGTAMSPAGGRRLRTSKEEFTSTLIHELFHYFDNNTQHLDPNDVATPTTLMIIMANPGRFGFGSLGFGWFDHPVTGRGMHLDDVVVGEQLVGDPEAMVAPDTTAGRVKAAGSYESSPDGRDVEEDLSTTFAWFLTSEGTRRLLGTDHPKRFRLMQTFFSKMLPASMPKTMKK